MRVYHFTERIQCLCPCGGVCVSVHILSSQTQPLVWRPCHLSPAGRSLWLFIPGFIWAYEADMLTNSGVNLFSIKCKALTASFVKNKLWSSLFILNVMNPTSWEITSYDKIKGDMTDCWMPWLIMWGLFTRDNWGYPGQWISGCICHFSTRSKRMQDPEAHRRWPSGTGSPHFRKLRPAEAATRKCRKTSGEDWKTGDEDCKMHTNSDQERLTEVTHNRSSCTWQEKLLVFLNKEENVFPVLLFRITKF